MTTRPPPRSIRAREREFLAAFQSAGLDDFPVDGRLYLFSSLQPPRSQDGALSLTTMRENWLNATIFVLVILGGALLLPAPAALEPWRSACC